MPSTTPNYGLAIYDNLPAGDQLENFLDYRTAQAGVGATSNMALIDDAMNDNALAITALEAKKNIIAVSAIFNSPNTYLATVSGYTVYGTNDVIDVVLNIDSDATVQLNINSLGLKSLMKINSSGTPVNLDNTNLLADRHYMFSYDGTRWVWIGATSADQIDIGGTAANLVAIASDGSLEDSGSKPSDFSTIALDNLASVQINTDLISDTDDTDSLGSAAKAWKALLTYASRIKEKASATADVAGWGEFWVKNDVPNIPMFTDDAGTDFKIANMAYTTATVTTGNVTLVEGEFIDLTISGMTADRDALLPTPSAAGVVCALRIITNAPSTYELVVKANTFEITRLYSSSESLFFRSTGTGAGDWTLSEGGDGRIANVAKLNNGTAQIDIVSSSTTSLEFDTVEIDNGSITDVASDRIIARRDGNYEIFAFVTLNLNDQDKLSIFIDSNATAQIRKDISVSSSGVTIATNSVRETLALSAGDIITASVNHTYGANRDTTTALVTKPRLSVAEIL